MKSRHSGGIADPANMVLSPIILLVLALVPICAQTPLQSAPGREFMTTGPDLPHEVLTRNQGIQRTIEKSTQFFQAAEESFRNANFDRARRDYDRSLDSILESGIDVRSDGRLLQHYRLLVEQIYQRQMTLMSMAPAGSAQVAANGGAEQGEAVAKGRGDRGFGQQSFEPSPLDELARLDLTPEETQGATVEQAQKAVAAARVDFSFRPNALIQSFINYYTGRGRGTMEQGLRRAGRFMTMARRIFKEEGVPQDLFWLGQVESAWSPIARSWASAVGLWQFIPGTAARYGLQMDYYVDERCSFEKATRASARYLKFLADRYDGNWELAMAAYNTGEGRVDSAIARSGYADFWEIYSRGLIPRETRNYVPNILATIIIAKNPERYGFSVKPEPSLTYDYVKVNNLVDLRLAADATDTPHELLQVLNPELKRGVTPPGSEYLLRVPSGKGGLLQASLKKIPADKRASWRMLTAQSGDSFESIARRTGLSAESIEQVNGGIIAAGQKVIIPVSSNVRNVVLSSARTAVGAPVASSSNAKLITYRVRQGESLGDIAGRYNTSAREIATINRLGISSKLRAGQVIKVPVRQGR